MSVTHGQLRSAIGAWISGLRLKDEFGVPRAFPFNHPMRENVANAIEGSDTVLLAPTAVVRRFVDRALKAGAIASMRLNRIMEAD